MDDKGSCSHTVGVYLLLLEALAVAAHAPYLGLCVCGRQLCLLSEDRKASLCQIHSYQFPSKRLGTGGRWTL